MADLERLVPDLIFTLKWDVGAVLFRMHCCWISVGSHMERYSAGQCGGLSVVEINKLVAEKELSPSLDL